MTPQQAYIEFCKTHEVSLFQTPEWLSMMGKQWDCIHIREENDELWFPFIHERKWTFRFLRNGFLTPYAGWIFSDVNIRQERKEILVRKLMEQLPEYDILHLDIHPWHSLEMNFPDDIQQINKHTNLIRLTNVPEVYANFKPALTRQIKKSLRSLHIIESHEIALFYNVYQKTFFKQGQKPPIPFQAFEQVWNFLQQTNSGKLFLAIDEQQNTHAALLLAYDSSTAYYLSGGTDAEFYGSGAMSGLMWHAIQYSLQLGKKYFDFEGSMIPSVDRFFKNFGTEEISYTTIQKTNSLLFKLLKKNKA